VKVEGIEPEKENPGGEERRGDCLINLTALTTCAGVCYAMLGWQGGGGGRLWRPMPFEDCPSILRSPTGNLPRNAKICAT